MTADDPTAPLAERSMDQVSAYVDDHLIMALVGAHALGHDRQTAEDYLRDRLAAISDTWQTAQELEREEARRRSDRLRRVLSLP